ncbi:helix-turn-helix transcriptional regulator [Virgibacillus halodenitrificans]|uniref:helix-turn-helix transcriptional regulator n=1 Tax=Virgibacillus halodenitrificans TaxID=1482 RepID=UPI000EF50159|nr:helix-turn-helix transcriptional regulator [Virgibacillus halodenitrificans]
MTRKYKVGKSIKGLRKRQDLTQENMASDLHVSKQLVSHMENNRRTMSEELIKSSVSFYSDAAYGFEMARETARDYITPLTNGGKAVEWHRLALEEVFKREATEAINRFNEVSLVKPPQYVDEEEKSQIIEGIKELLDVQASINSFLVGLEQEYNVCVKDCMRSRLPEWKAKGLIV